MPELTYTQRGDYLLPDIVLSDPPDAEPLTKYGMMRKRHLKEHHKITYGLMLTREELYPIAVPYNGKQRSAWTN